MHTYNELPAEWNITVHRGAVWECTGRIETGSSLLDTTGYAMEFTIKESPADDAPVVASYTTANARCLTGINTDGTDQVNWWIRLSGTDTQSLAPGVYYHNIWLTPPGGASERECIFAGTCCIEPEVRS